MQPLERPAVLVFDLDGTLEDSRPDMVESINRVRASYGLEPLSFEQASPMVTAGMRHLYKTAFPEKMQSTAETNQSVLAEIETKYLSDYAEHIANETKLYTGIDPVLTRLVEHFPFILYTNKPEHHSKLLLNALELHIFDEIMGGDTLTVSKPSSEPVEIALKRIAEKRGLSPMDYHIAVIGDSQGDMKIAENLKQSECSASVTSIWVRWGYCATVPQSPGPDYIADIPDDLLQLLA